MLFLFHIKNVCVQNGIVSVAGAVALEGDLVLTHHHADGSVVIAAGLYLKGDGLSPNLRIAEISPPFSP